MIIWDPVVFIRCLYKVEHCFKFPDYHHVVIDPEKILICEVLLLIFYRFVVLVNRNLTEFNEFWFSDNFRINVLTLWHIVEDKIGTGYWDTGSWILGTGYWVLGTGYS